jgi:hypothetical protein
MAALATQLIVDAGTAPTFAAANTSDTAEVGSGHDTFVVYKNTNAATRTVTITAPGTTDYGQPFPDPVLTLGATTGELWIPMRKGYDASDGTGRATLTLSATTNVTVAVVRHS